MNTYAFPRITHLNQVLDAVVGKDEFTIKTDTDHDLTIVNYHVNLASTFPVVTDEQTALLRECRGITFKTSTGQILSRKYHKFFNMGERPETTVKNIDWKVPFRRFEKLDGSMITPLLVDDQVRWCTKMGLTDVAKQVDVFTQDKANYLDFARHWMAAGYTPIFEWCSRNQRIVIDYPVSALVLTAIRNNEFGTYLSYEQMTAEAAVYDISLVTAGPEITTGYDEALVTEVRQYQGREGDVWRDVNGHMVKLKGDQYCLLHKTLDHFSREKDVVLLIVTDKVDDIKPLLPVDQVQSVDEFAAAMFTGLRKSAVEFYTRTAADFVALKGNRKDFALQIAGRKEARFLFWVWANLPRLQQQTGGGGEGEDGVYEYLLSTVKEQCASQTKLNDIRWVWGGAVWETFRDSAGGKPLGEEEE